MNNIVSIEFVANQELHFETKDNLDQKDYLLYYVLRGEITIESSQKTYKLAKGDIIVMNPFEKYLLRYNNCDYITITLNSAYLFETTKKGTSFFCNSLEENGENIRTLRGIIENLVKNSVKNGNEVLLYNKLVFDFLTFMTSHFSSNKDIESKEKSRKREIAAYIDFHYRDELPLNDIASKFELTPQYFSKYFKKEFGTTFLKYLTNLRVHSAKTELLTSTSNVLKIALDNGFPNFSSFTKAFKDIYHESPSEYRENNKNRDLQIKNIDFAEKLYLEDDYSNSQNTSHHIEMSLSDNPKKIDNYWFELINLGSASKILGDGIKNQINVLQKELQFKCARIILDCFDLSQNTYSIYLEEKIFDFMIELNFDLLIVIDYRSYCNHQNFLEYFKKMLSHCINRYGIKNVNKWKFELFYNTDFLGDKPIQYRNFFMKLIKIMHSLNLSGNIMGPGLLLDQNGANLERLLKTNTQLKEITINIAPYHFDHINENTSLNRTKNSNYILEQVNTASKIMSQYGLDSNSLFVTSWTHSLHDFNFLNDSSFRGADIIRNILSGYHNLNCLPLEKPLDLMYNQKELNKPLSGLPGIISRDGVKKPSFYSYQFLKKLDKWFLFKDDFVLVTNDGDKYFQIVCHNCNKLNNYFYLTEEKGGKTDHINDFFNNNKDKSISITINGVKNGVYFFKNRKINEEFGSCLSTLLKMNYDDVSFFGRDELNFLKSLSKPAITGKEIIVRNNQLKIEINLKPNEFDHIHLIYSH